MSERSLNGRTILMSGGSRGIGLAIALRAAADGANVVMLAKTGEPHPKLTGTVYTAAQEVEDAGGKALPVVGDVREEADVQRAVDAAVETFGGIDIVINNASAIDTSPTRELQMKRYDLMQSINTRGTFLLSKTAIPHLERGTNPHILTLSPPIDLDPKWVGPHTGYTLSKYGMSLCTIGLAAELADAGIAANSLWPRTPIVTAAILNRGGADRAATARTPEIMSDAAHAILTRDSRTCTGNFFLDDSVLIEESVTDFAQYRTAEREEDLRLDMYVSGRVVTS
ncbi:citronellol/citronellal dehydrogenase [Gordonia amarae]|nr:NAD(P)-dependent oxidoreductase [Gordonia amarae]MCS3877398.1 citronellol/citronellal dehydrogenase [Gordonia amarae]GAB07256.1 putative oxidoreductase [Gordonia amarae NBRC 15530]